MVSLHARHTGIDTLVDVSELPRRCVSGFVTLRSSFFKALCVKGVGYSVALAGEIGEAAEEGGVLSDRFERNVPLSEECDDDIDRLFCSAARVRIWRHNSVSSTGESCVLSFIDCMDFDVGMYCSSRGISFLEPGRS